MRQWVPQTQHAIDTLVLEVLKRGAHPDDRDSLTDMTLLMYSCKAGASGVGNVGSSVKIVNYLVELGCDLTARCRSVLSRIVKFYRLYSETEFASNTCYRIY